MGREVDLGARVCPLCGAAVAGALPAREMMLGLRDRFHYGECTRCSTLVLLDPPGDLGPYYPADYYSLRPRPRGRPVVRLAKRIRAEAAARGLRRISAWLGLGAGPPRWAAWLEVADLDRSAAICDVGCGSGAALFEMRDEGFTDLVGVDPFVERPLDRGSVRIHRATVREISGSFELVMFNHSFEHLPDPVESLCAAAGLLRPGGTVMVRTPIAGSWAWRRYGVDWVGLDAPRHLFVPTEAGLRAAARRAGLDCHEIVYDSTEMQFWRSEQYQRNVPLFDPASHEVDPGGSPYSRRRIRAWRREADRLNRAGDGDTAAAFLRPLQAGASGERRVS